MAYLGMSSPDVYRAAVRSGLAITYLVNASAAGSTVATDLRPVGGSITDTTKPGVRRLLNLDLAPAPGLYATLSPTGLTLSVTARVMFTDRTTADIPMGVFDADSVKLSEGGGGLSITAPDKWVRIKRARFLRPQASTPGMYASDQIAALIRGALGASEPVNFIGTGQGVMGAQVWEKDRDKAINDIASGLGWWVFFDRNGLATIADLPTVGSSVDWLIDASPSGVLTELDRSQSRESTSNVVVVESSSADTPFTTQIVWDSDPFSPTYAGPDPLGNPSAAGPFGVVPYYYDTPLPLSDDAANQTAHTILARVTGLAKQVSLGAVPNPAVDAFDVLEVIPPRESPNVSRVTERQIADTVTHPFSVATAQTIDGRSTRVDEL